MLGFEVFGTHRSLLDAYSQAAEEAGAAFLRERNRDPGERLTMVSFSWKIGGFGVVGSATVAIDNANDFPVKDIDVRCEFGGNISQKTTFDTIPAKLPSRNGEAGLKNRNHN
jgi:hypothetical protein